MQFYSPESIIGDTVRLKAGHKNHYGFSNIKDSNRKESQSINFGKLLLNKLNEVNDTQLFSHEMTTKLAVAPEEVNIHEVMIAAQKAEMSLSFTKSLRDKIINAYKELIGMR